MSCKRLLWGVGNLAHSLRSSSYVSVVVLKTARRARSWMRSTFRPSEDLQEFQKKWQYVKCGIIAVFISYYHAWLQPVSLQVVLEYFFSFYFSKKWVGRAMGNELSIKLRLPNSTLALLKSQHNWLKWLDGNVDFVWIFSFDFSNAFDSVSPKILVVLVSLRYWYRSLYSELAYQFR